MEVKKFIATNMQEGIAKVKAELGASAMILSSRKIRHGKNLFGLMGKEMIEIRASAGMPSQQLPSHSQALQSKKGAPSPSYNNYDESTESYASSSQAADTAKSLRDNVVAPLKAELEDVREAIDDIREFTRNYRSDEQTITYLRHDINDLKSLLNSYMEGGGTIPIKNLHRNLASVFQQLMLNGIEEKFARRLIEESMFKIQPQNIDSLSYVRLFIARMLMPLVKVHDMFAEDSRTSGRICLIGPTGVGKTTTIAKIAGMIREKDDKAKIGIISFDNFRAGTIEQLKDISKTLKLKFKSAETPADFKRQMKELSDMDYVLIDSFGASQRDNEKNLLLKGFLDEQPSIEKLLVLNSSIKDADITEQTKRFGTMKLSGVIFTKLDESSMFGSVVNHMIRFKIPLYFLTAGQKVPDDIEIATKERVIDLVMNFSAEEVS